jgi:uncharacterized protein (TIGR03066 family)
MRISLAATLSLLVFGLCLSAARAEDKKDEKKDEKAKDLIVGKWNPDDEKAKDKLTLEFTKDGKVLIKGDLGGNAVDASGTYKFLGDDKMEIEISFMGETKKETVGVKVTKDELTTTDSKDMKHTFKRIKK